VAVNPFPVQLSPGYGYPFPGQPNGYSILRGEVRSATGQPAAGAEVVAATTGPGGTPPAWTDAYLTDGTGQWLSVIPDARAGPIAITATGPDGTRAQATVPVAASSLGTVPPLILT
jgi:hypothetical protein